MNCESVAERLPELLAGALDRETEQDVLFHLAGCAECRQELAFWAQLRQAVREDAAEAPEGLIRDVRAGLFGPRVTSVLESFRQTGRALGLAGSACKLAFSAVTKF